MPDPSIAALREAIQANGSEVARVAFGIKTTGRRLGLLIALGSALLSGAAATAEQAPASTGIRRSNRLGAKNTLIIVMRNSRWPKSS